MKSSGTYHGDRGACLPGVQLPLVMGSNLPPKIAHQFPNYVPGHLLTDNKADIRPVVMV